MYKEDKTKYNFLYTILNDGDSKDVYVSILDGVIKINHQFYSDEFKKKYNVFVDAYKKSGFFEILRDNFHQFQANLYIKNKNTIQNFFSKILTPIPKINQYGNFLDVGCNTGDFLSKLSDPWKRYGIELNEEACRQSLKYKNIKVFNTSLEDFKTDLKFDFVRLSHVIEHIYDYHKFLTNLYDIMNRNSYALIYTPNTNSLSYKIFKKNWNGFFEKTHVNLFNLKNLENICIKHNFEIIDKGTYYMGIFSDSLLRNFKLNSNPSLYKIIFYFLFLFFYPFSFIVNAFKLGGAFFIYVHKN